MGGDIVGREQGFDQFSRLAQQLLDRLKPHGITDCRVIGQQQIQDCALAPDFDGLQQKPPAVQAAHLINLEHLLHLLVVGDFLRGHIPHDDLGAGFVIHPGRRAFQQDREDLAVAADPDQFDRLDRPA